MKSFRLYKPECPECGSKNCGFAHSIENWIDLLIFGTMHYYYRIFKNESFWNY